VAQTLKSIVFYFLDSFSLLSCPSFSLHLRLMQSVPSHVHYTQIFNAVFFKHDAEFVNIRVFSIVRIHTIYFYCKQAFIEAPANEQRLLSLTAWHILFHLWQNKHLSLSIFIDRKAGILDIKELENVFVSVRFRL